MRSYKRTVELATKAIDAATNDARRHDRKRGGYGLENRVSSIGLYAPGGAEPNAYAERGYSAPIAVTGDWNTVDTYDKASGRRVMVVGGDVMERLARLFTKLGIATEWSDEWTSCDDCNGLVRTSPDSHGWTPSYNEAAVGDGECVCLACSDATEDEDETDDECMGVAS